MINAYKMRKNKQSCGHSILKKWPKKCCSTVKKFCNKIILWCKN